MFDRDRARRERSLEPRHRCRRRRVPGPRPRRENGQHPQISEERAAHRAREQAGPAEEAIVQRKLRDVDRPGLDSERRGERGEVPVGHERHP